MTRALPMRPLDITGEQVVPPDAPVGGPESVFSDLSTFGCLSITVVFPDRQDAYRVMTSHGLDWERNSYV